MNELIQALLLQSKNPNTGMVEEEKFAELIIKQCCNVVDAQNYYVYSGDVKKLILERFGVTE
jgi:hypothetical protein